MTGQTLHPHVARLRAALDGFDDAVPQLQGWGRHLAQRLLAGGRLLVAGNGGSAAEAQHLTAELVGRYERDRPPLSAIPLHADSSTVTAVANDYGPDEIFARQVRAHGRAGDVMLLLSTSGASPNVLRAADAGRSSGLRVLAMTGPLPNPLAYRVDDAIGFAAETTATVQELHLVAVHILSAAVDEVVLGAHRNGQAHATDGHGGRS